MLIFRAQLQYIDDILRWRSVTMADHVLYSVINAKVREDHYDRERERE